MELVNKQVENDKDFQQFVRQIDDSIGYLVWNNIVPKTNVIIGDNGFFTILFDWMGIR